MALTATQIANTNADQFDVQLRYFSAIDYKALILAYYEEGNAPVGWTISGDSITPATGWTEVTNRVFAKGSLTYQRSGSSIYWRTDLSGSNYSTNYFGVGCAVMCLRKITRLGYDSGWLIWWIGVVDAGAWRSDYRNGLDWQRTVRGTDHALRLTDSPRITVGRINLAEGATVSTSSTLATPSVEAANGEFVGTTATVSSGNIVDQRLGSVWISQAPPSSADAVIVFNAQRIKVDEVFFKPVTGYDPDKSWWVELVNASNNGTKIDLAPMLFVSYTALGQAVAVWFPNAPVMEAGSRVIICGDRATFEATTGGGKSATVLAANETPHSHVVTFTETPAGSGLHTAHLAAARTAMTLNAAGGYVFTAPYVTAPFGDKDGVKWGTDRALPSGAVASDIWTGATVDISSITPGQSIRRISTGGGAGGGSQDSNAAADWQIEPYPTPGDKFAKNRFEWVQIELPPHVSTLAGDITGASTEIEIEEGTTGWPGSGDGDIESDTFTYTGRTATHLTGVTGISSNHVAGALLFPYANSMDQTGWKCTAVEFDRRPGTAYIKRWEMWVSESPEADTPDGEDPSDVLWQIDYDEPHYTGTNINGMSLGGFVPGSASITVNLAPDSGSRWVRTILINILEMFPEAGEVTGARAKLNEAKVVIDDLTLADSGVADLPGVTAGVFAEYLVDEYSWLQLSDFDDASGPGWGDIGILSLAISPLPTVLEDMARSHGSVIRYALDGSLHWERDLWWPGGVVAHPDCSQGPIFRWEPSTVRGEIVFTTAGPSVTGIALSATDGNGAPLERVTSPPGVTGSGVREFTNLVVPNQDYARLLASAMELQETNQEWCTFKVRGVGEWCWPTQTYLVEWPDGVERGVWQAEQVTWNWAFLPSGKRWETSITCRRMMVG